MLDTDFWGEIISVYTDADAIDDGILTDIGELGAEFNGRIIDRMTDGAVSALHGAETLKGSLSAIAAGCSFDGTGADAWGIFQPDERFGNEKLWLIPNETGGYTLMLPSEY